MCRRRKKKYENITFLILLSISFSFIIWRFTPTVKLIKNLVYCFSYSSLSLVDYVFYSSENLTKGIKSIICTSRENVAYKQKNLELTDKLRNYDAMVRKYDDLLKLFKLTKVKNTISVFARISIRDPNKWYRWFIINKGEKDGLYNELPVLVFSKKKGALCAVGRIVETYGSSSKVALITNAAYAFPVEIKGKGVNCLAEGLDLNLLRITYIPCDADVKAGDEVVVSELSSVFHKDTPVGVITNVSKEPSVDFKTAMAKVFFETDIIYEAVILIPEIKI
ncbi:MAG: rod shape-determining protein MreC [Endomicrobium sp.]|jgi:rod shape-determining protein MreC|nr:rod shape-determining protein MreC [Endomicrobium sp.]